MSAVLGEVASVRFLRGRLMDEGMRLFGSLIILMPGRSILRRTVLGKDSLVVASEVDILFDSKGEFEEVHIPIRGMCSTHRCRDQKAYKGYCIAFPGINSGPDLTPTSS